MQGRVTDLLHGSPYSPAVVAAIVLPTQHGLVGKLRRVDEILETKLRGIHFELVRHDIRHALDGMNRFGDPERATVRDYARRLVSVDDVHFDVRGIAVVRACVDM